MESFTILSISLSLYFSSTRFFLSAFESERTCSRARIITKEKRKLSIFSAKGGTRRECDVGRRGGAKGVSLSTIER